jgi:predicted ATPase
MTHVKKESNNCYFQSLKHDEKPSKQHQTMFYGYHNEYIIKHKINMEDIPMMSVIAGINGIGKSSVIKAIVDRLKDKNICHFHISNNNHEIKYLEDQIRDYDQNINQKINNFSKYIIDRTDPKFLKIEETEELFKEYKNLNQWSIREKCLKLFMQTKNPMSPIFKLHYRYYLKFLNPSKLEKLNKFLKKEKFKYVLKEIKDRFENFEFKLANKDDETLSPSYMSDGEQLIFTYLLWKFDEYPSCLNDKIVYLLDEPDCHLHPAAVKPLIEGIQNLANKMKIQVIMTTHNPITINFLNENNDEQTLFIMNYDQYDSNIINILRASESHIHPSVLLTNDLVSVSKPCYFQIYVQSKIEKKFYTKLNDQNNLTNRQIIFTYIDEKTKHNETNEKTDNYKIMAILNILSGNTEFGEETKFLKDYFQTRMGLSTKSSESKIIDFIEISSKNENLNFIYGLLDRNDLFKTHGAKSKIIYPERHDIGNYIFDPLNFYLFAKAQNEYSNSSLLKKLIEIQNSCSSWYQKVLDEFTDAIKKQQINQSNENQKAQVSLICPNIKLEYEDFLLSTKSEILIKYMLQALALQSFEPIENCSKELLQKNKRKQKNEEESLKMKKKLKTDQTDTIDIM